MSGIHQEQDYHHVWARFILGWDEWNDGLIQYVVSITEYSEWLNENLLLLSTGDVAWFTQHCDMLECSTGVNAYSTPPMLETVIITQITHVPVLHAAWNRLQELLTRPASCPITLSGHDEVTYHDRLRALQAVIEFQAWRVLHRQGYVRTPQTGDNSWYGSYTIIQHNTYHSVLDDVHEYSFQWVNSQYLSLEYDYLHASDGLGLLASIVHRSRKDLCWNEDYSLLQSAYDSITDTLRLSGVGDEADTIIREWDAQHYDSPVTVFSGLIDDSTVRLRNLPLLQYDFYDVLFTIHDTWMDDYQHAIPVSCDSPILSEIIRSVDNSIHAVLYPSLYRYAQVLGSSESQECLMTIMNNVSSVRLCGGNSVGRQWQDVRFTVLHGGVSSTIPYACIGLSYLEPVFQQLMGCISKAYYELCCLDSYDSSYNVTVNVMLGRLQRRVKYYTYRMSEIVREHAVVDNTGVYQDSMLVH